MHIDEVRQMVQLVEESDIDELEVWKWWGRIKIKKTPSSTGIVAAAPAAAPASPAPPVEAPGGASAEAAAASEGGSEEEGLVPVPSPMVGTFYRAPAPDADPFVKVGDRVEAGQTVCIVEAMKLMNEIQSDVSGTVAKIAVDNQSPVEFGQTLFLIKQD